MKKWILPAIVILLLFSGLPVNGETNVQVASFSNSLEINSTYEWNIDNYQVGTQRVEYKSSPTSFEMVHGTDVELTVTQDPSEINLVTNSSLTNATYLSEYFNLEYDDIAYDFDKADQLFIWIFPSDVLGEDGSSIDIFKEFWIYNVYNLLSTGETLEFNSTLPTNGAVTSSTDDGEQIITLSFPDSSIQARIDQQTGVMNNIDFISDTPDYRIEIDRGGAGSALPLSPIWSIIPLIAIPIIYRKIKS